MAKRQKDDDFLSTRALGVTAQRNYDYETHDYNEETGEKVKKENAPTEEQWKKTVIEEITEIANQDNVSYCYFIFHDSDRLENGRLKPLHVHIVIKFKNARRMGALMKLLNVSRSENISPVRSYKGALGYLLHITEQAKKDGKFIYSQRELYMAGEEIPESEKLRYAHFDKIAKSGDKPDKDTKEEIEKDVLDMMTKVRKDGIEPNINDLYKKYSTQDERLVTKIYYSHDSKMEQAEKDYFKDKTKDIKKNGRNLLNVYISGPGNTGKTTLANALGYHYCDERGVYSAPSKSQDKTYDPFGKYKYEKVTILNEMVGGLFEPRELMNMIDPMHYVPVSARGADVNWLSDTMIMTSSISFERFRNETFRYAKGGKDKVEQDFVGNLKMINDAGIKDEAYQFTRRFSHKIDIKHKGSHLLMNIFAFDKEKYGFRLQKQLKLPVQYYYDEDKLQKVVNIIDDCIKNTDKDVTLGKVQRDNDLIQKEEHIDDNSTYDEKIKIDYKKINMKTFGVKYEREMLELYNEEIKEFVDSHRIEYYRYVLTVKYKFGIDEIAHVNSLDEFHKLQRSRRNEPLYRQDEFIWKLEFYDYLNGNIPCAGLTYEQEDAGMTLNDKIKKHKEEERKKRRENQAMNINKHKAFNDKVGVTEKDIDEFTDSKVSAAIKNPFNV
jgi:hypothetical protein